MPCYQCGVRQTDPVRGGSPWKRAVCRDALVLICPECQTSGDWARGLDRCGNCASTTLICRLGEVECRECGSSRPAVRDSEPLAGSAEVPGLAEEVEAALDRVLKGSRRPVAR